MATSNIKHDDEDNEQWQAAQTIHDQHQWNPSSSDEDDEEKGGVDNHEFFDAHDTDFNHHQQQQQQTTTTEINPEADLLHQRLNAQLSTDEEPKKKKSPG